MLLRRNGLLSDHLRRVRLVDAQGRVRDSARHPIGDDILWACRGGGGGSFGVVTDLPFDLVAIPSHVLTFSVKWAWDAATLGVVLPRWMRLSGAPRELMSIFTVAAGSSQGMHCFGQFLGTESELQPVIDTLSVETSPSESRVDRVRFIDAVDGFAGKLSLRQSWKMKSSLGTEPIDEAGIAAIVASVQGARPSFTAVLEFDSLGGAQIHLVEGETGFNGSLALLSVSKLSELAASSRMRAHAQDLV